MRQIFDIERTVRCYRLWFAQHDDVLAELLRSVARTLDRLLPPAVSRRIDREGSTLEQAADEQLAVRRHPDLEAARRALADLGLFRIFVPEAHGGFGLPVAVYYLAVQLVSYFDTSLALVFLVHGNAMYVIDRYGTEAQRRRYLPELVTGELLATVAFTEPQAGSDAGSIRTRAVSVDGGSSYRLEGSKQFITHGGDADLLVTTARTGPPEAGIHGVSTFIVERADGVEVVGLEDKTGLGGSPTASLSYPGVIVPADRLLGSVDRGGEVMLAGVGMTRVNIGAQALGIAKRAFDAACDFALQREQGGARIVEHDAIQQRLVEMALTISAMEHLICHVAHLEQRGAWHVREMSTAKYFCSEALQELTLRAINVFGGYGTSRDHVVERCRREAVALPLYGGTSEIQWYIIARELLEAHAGRGHADYRGRDRELLVALQRRCGEIAAQVTAAAEDVLRDQVRRLGRAQEELWRLVEVVAARYAPSGQAAYHRHLTELATALAAASVLLWQATAASADDLDRELAAVAVDRLEVAAHVAAARVDGGVSRAGVKRAVRRRLAGEV